MNAIDLREMTHSADPALRASAIQLLNKAAASPTPSMIARMQKQAVEADDPADRVVAINWLSARGLKVSPVKYGAPTKALEAQANRILEDSIVEVLVKSARSGKGRGIPRENLVDLFENLGEQSARRIVARVQKVAAADLAKVAKASFVKIA